MNQGEERGICDVCLHSVVLQEKCSNCGAQIWDQRADGTRQSPRVSDAIGTTTAKKLGRRTQTRSAAMTSAAKTASDLKAMTKTTDTPEDRAPETQTTDKPYLGYGRDLAPCPFCGGRVRQYIHDFGGGQQCGTAPLGIECKTCAVKAASEIMELKHKLSQAEQMLAAMTSSRDANGDALLHISRDKALPSESYQVQIGSLQYQLKEMRDHRDRWYAAAGQRQDELNQAHQALAWVCKNLPFEDGEKLPVELRPPSVVSRQVGIAKNAWSGWLEDNK